MPIPTYTDAELPHKITEGYRLNVGIILFNTQGLVLVAERVDYPEHFQFPQGGIDSGETPDVAVWRELEEEMGISPTCCRLVAQTPYWVCYTSPKNARFPKIKGSCQRWFLAEFAGDESKITPQLVEKPEFSSHKWVQPSWILENIVPFKQEVYRHILGEFAPRILAEIK